MSATEQPRTFSDLYTDLLSRMNAQTGVTATTNLAKRLINTALQDMHIGFTERVPWAEREATLVTQPLYDTGTVSITQGSTTLTGSGTAWNTNNAFGVANARTSGRIRIAGLPEVYKISAVGGDTAITLASRFIGETITDAAYQYFEDEYALAADFLRPLDMRYFDRARTVRIDDRNAFYDSWPVRGAPGQPSLCTIVDRPPSGDTTPVRRVLFNRPTLETHLFEYRYVTSKLAVSSAGAAQEALSADTDEPIVPLRYRQAIVLHAEGTYFRKRDDARSNEAFRAYTDLMVRLGADNEIGQGRVRLRPQVGGYTSRAKRPWRGGTGGIRMISGSAFDQFRE